MPRKRQLLEISMFKAAQIICISGILSLTEKVVSKLVKNFSSRRETTSVTDVNSAICEV